MNRFFVSKPAGFLALCLLAIFLAGSSACKKQRLLENGGTLRFSTDTLRFDTVFTSLASATRSFKIFNPQDERVLLSSVRLAAGDASYFQLNVDGHSGRQLSDIEIGAKDSIYVFATVKVDPTNANTPFIIEDKLIATLNGTDFSVPLIAYGQNAHFITDSVLHTQTWLRDKPYVLFGYALVDSQQTLTIPAGCRVYMHANARLFVDGTLIARGTRQDSIIFQGDRLDRDYYGYEGYPGEWGGLYFTQRSKGNVLEHVILRNGGNGAQGAPSALIQLAPDSVHDLNAPQLTMSKVILENSIGYGLLSFGGTIRASNCLIQSCGANALALVQGGDYLFDYCSIATYGNAKIAHIDNPSAVILNYYAISQTQTIVAPLNATLRNCVVAGSLTNEFVADSIEYAAAPAQLSLVSCVLKGEAQKMRPWVSQNNVRMLSEASPGYDSLFRAPQLDDYHPATGSPLVGAAAASPVPDDLEDRPRSIPSDIGCYIHE
ncbi:MAG: hypothetical protein JST06_06945 [Bacteroidetes bacterium]|nr:hypothetical protein [Bacteroidota bacterium]MBS1629028.1 hypothetical protein [Bacteroidota bacterium]